MGMRTPVRTTTSLCNVPVVRDRVTADPAVTSPPSVDPTYVRRQPDLAAHRQPSSPRR